MWEVLWKDDVVVVSPHSTGNLSAPRILYLIRPRMTGRKDWGITWTILLANIFHPLSPQAHKQQGDSGEIEGGQRGERESWREGDQKNERERYRSCWFQQPSMAGYLLQGHVSV